MAFFNNETIWRWLTNFWTVVLSIFLVVNFLSHDAYHDLTPLFSILYTGVLSLYVGTKEFERWYDRHESRHPGEWFIIWWTVLVVAMLLFVLFAGQGYRVAPEAVADYVMVLSIFAVTQKSKNLHRKKRVHGPHHHPAHRLASEQESNNATHGN
ncbi:MAG: hypothetical protein Q7S28_00590 [bacterium]|nr:hypothetical protein [bacterium]